MYKQQDCIPIITTYRMLSCAIADSCIPVVHLKYLKLIVQAGGDFQANVFGYTEMFFQV